MTLKDPSALLSISKQRSDLAYQLVLAMSRAAGDPDTMRQLSKALRPFISPQKLKAGINSLAAISNDFHCAGIGFSSDP